jgi:hypothetical protein
VLIGIHSGFDQTIEEIDAAASRSIEIELLDMLGRRGLALRQCALKADKTQADGKRKSGKRKSGSAPPCLR